MGVDRKASELTVLVTPAAGDYLKIVDISEPLAANRDKALLWSTIQALAAAGNTALQPADLNTLAELNALIADATLGDSADFATAAQGAKADTALQNAAAFATAAQGAKADTAVQPATNKPTEFLALAVGDETTSLTTGAAKITFRIPYAFTLTDVQVGVNTAPTGANIIVDLNEAGVSIFSTNLSIDASEETSTTAVTPRVISDASIAAWAKMTVDIDQVGSVVAGAGLQIYLVGYRT